MALSIAELLLPRQLCSKQQCNFLACEAVLCVPFPTLELRKERQELGSGGHVCAAAPSALDTGRWQHSEHQLLSDCTEQTATLEV